MLNNKLLYKNIVSLCEKNGIKITNLEKNLGFGGGVIGRWKDKADPSLSKVLAVAEYFGMTVDELVWGDIGNETGQFVSKLIEMTKSKAIAWMDYRKKCLPTDDGYEYINDRDCDIEGFSDHPGRRMEMFILKDSDAFITLDCYFIINNYSIEKYDIHLYVQPQAGTKPVHQNCNQRQLLELYKTIAGETPESLADNYKRSFLKRYSTP